MTLYEVSKFAELPNTSWILTNIRDITLTMSLPKSIVLLRTVYIGRVHWNKIIDLEPIQNIES